MRTSHNARRRERRRRWIPLASFGLANTLGLAVTADATSAALAPHGVGGARSLRGQPPMSQDPAAVAQTRAPVPWGVGERLGYDVKFGILRVGSGTMEVPEVVDVRGQPTYHTSFHISGGTFFYKVNDTFESWIDVETLASRRFHQTQLEGGRTRLKKYELFPERSTYQDDSKPEEKSVSDPLDDGSFLYYVRTLPLRPGDVYESNRYFKPDRNPVRIRVVRREQVKVPAGTFNAIVVAPTIKTKGIFSEGGRAEVWLSDDDERIMLKMHSSLSFGSITMELRSRTSGQK